MKSKKVRREGILSTFPAFTPSDRVVLADIDNSPFTIHNMKHLIIAIGAVLISAAGLRAQDINQRKKNFNLEDGGLAIQGYDPVAYFQGKAVKGSKTNAVSHQGVVYYFSSVANKEAFKASPTTYEPQYGGWCAYAMGAKGEKVSIDPKTFKIVNGKLYLFYNRFFNNTLEDWNKDEAGLKNKADRNWQNILH